MFLGVIFLLWVLFLGIPLFPFFGSVSTVTDAVTLYHGINRVVIKNINTAFEAYVYKIICTDT